ncbi:MAG: TetR/AcrR family transcriptional regulator [Phycisphaeraceae bacterium]|nr:TetR/AcrR family transcriptional regulator [Phycisphaeraceae bacterium]
MRATRKSIPSGAQGDPAPASTARAGGAPNGASRAAPSGTRERLITAAANLFVQHGFGPVGLDRIIAEVGVTKTTFYNHFESKDDLIIAVLAERHAIEIEDLEQDIRRRGGEDPKAQLLAIFDSFDDWFRSTDFRGCIFMSAATEFPTPTDPINQAARVHGEGLFELLRTRVEQAGLDADKAESIASQMMVLLTGAIAARHVNREMEAAKHARLVAEAVLNACLTSAK